MRIKLVTKPSLCYWSTWKDYYFKLLYIFWYFEVITKKIQLNLFLPHYWNMFKKLIQCLLNTFHFRIMFHWGYLKLMPIEYKFSFNLLMSNKTKQIVKKFIWHLSSLKLCNCKTSLLNEILWNVLLNVIDWSRLMPHGYFSGKTESNGQLQLVNSIKINL
jgi:hypothetical protein